MKNAMFLLLINLDCQHCFQILKVREPKFRFHLVVKEANFFKAPYLLFHVLLRTARLAKYGNHLKESY